MSASCFTSRPDGGGRVASGFAVRLARAATVLCLLATCGPPALASPRIPDDWQAGYSAVRATVAAPADLDRARARIVTAGGKVGVIVPPSAYPGEAVFLGWIAAKDGSALLGQAGITQVLTPSSRLITSVTADAQHSPGLAFWQRVAAGDWTQPEGAPDPRAIGSDARVPGDLFPGGEPQGRAPGEGGQALTGTSDAMTGSVVTALFMAESNGSLDPNLYTWSPADSATEVSGVLGALSWWSGKAPTYGQSVTFTLVIHGPSSSVTSTKYEPVIHSSNEVSLWTSEILGHLGYTSGSDITRARNYANSLISTYRANWAFSIINGYNPLPAGDAYSNGVSAWAYLNGPYLQTLFRSYAWPVQQVTAHEIGHIFGACDEYAGACGCDVCTKNTLNANCEDCNPATVDCMMKANTYRLCTYTPGQLGWQTAVATVVVDTVVVSDPSPANNDGGADAGETVYLTITLENVGTGPARSVTGTMTTSDPYVTIQAGSSSFGDVILKSTGSSQYRLLIAAGAPVGHAATLNLALSGSNGFSSAIATTLVISPARLLRVTPTTVTNVAPVQLRLGGRHFLAGSSIVIEHPTYGSRTATGVTVVNTDSLTGTVDVTGIALSHWDVVVVSPGGYRAGLTSALYITPAGPGISAVTPTVGSALDSVTLILRGVNFNQPLGVWLEKGATKRYGVSLTVVTPESLRCGMSFKGLAPGVYDVVEQNFDTQVARLVGGVTINGPPDLQLVAPEVVGTGGVVAVTLQGTNFLAGGSASLTARNRTPIAATSLTYDSSTQVRVTFDLSSGITGGRNVVLRNPGGACDSLISALQIVHAPTAHVLHPNGGENFTPGASTTIGWTAQSLGNGLDHVLIELSLDGGLSYSSLIASAGPSDTSIVWVVPAANTDSARVRVIAYDIDNLSGFDDSDGNFVIGAVTHVEGEEAPRVWRLASRGASPGRTGGQWRLDVAERAPVLAEIFDVRGARVARLTDATLVPGRYDLRWDGRTDGGRMASAGMYVCRVQAGLLRLTARLLLAP